jgi:hypothetical protein
MATTEKNNTIEREDSISNYDDLSVMSDCTEVTVSTQIKTITSVQQFLIDMENEIQDISRNVTRESKKDCKSQN